MGVLPRTRRSRIYDSLNGSGCPYGHYGGMMPGRCLVGKHQAPANVLIGRVCPSWQGHGMAAVWLSHKRVFLGEGIMIELIFARGNDPAQVGHLPPQGSGGDTGR